MARPFLADPFGSCQAKCSHKYVSVRYVSVLGMPAATTNQAKWLHSQSCHRPWPIYPPYPILTCHLMQLICVSINWYSHPKQ